MSEDWRDEYIKWKKTEAEAQVFLRELSNGYLKSIGASIDYDAGDLYRHARVMFYPNGKVASYLSWMSADAMLFGESSMFECLRLRLEGMNVNRETKAIIAKWQPILALRECKSLAEMKMRAEIEGLLVNAE